MNLPMERRFFYTVSATVVIGTAFILAALALFGVAYPDARAAVLITGAVVVVCVMAVHFAALAGILGYAVAKRGDTRG